MFNLCSNILLDKAAESVSYLIALNNIELISKSQNGGDLAESILDCFNQVSEENLNNLNERHLDVYCTLFL